MKKLKIIFFNSIKLSDKRACHDNMHCCNTISSKFMVRVQSLKYMSNDILKTNYNKNKIRENEK